MAVFEVLVLRVAVFRSLRQACLVAISAASIVATNWAAELPPPAERSVDFAADIQPLLKKNCYSCHGAEHQEGGLRLDQKKRALEGGDGGAEIIAGKSAASRLVRMIAGTDDEFGRMPPDGKGTALSATEIGLIRAWIDQGAKWPDEAQVAAANREHWSLKPIVRPPLATMQDAQRFLEPIDSFVLARLEQERLPPSPPTDKTTILRRLSLDLIGLPPSPEEVEAFLNDDRPDAVSRHIDRLLASPHFGERWGRHWLDLARYADSDGYEKDRPRPFAYHYRDWVIRAINADMPFDQFTIEQIAGDMLPGANLADKIAAGFHRNTLHNTEGGTDPEEDRVKKTVDRTNTLGAVWLGLTVGCAQCHSHKYDPITQREYYSLYAFFNSLEEKDLENATPEQLTAFRKTQRAHATKLQQLEAAVKAYTQEKLPAAQSAWEKSLADLTVEQLKEKNLPTAAAAALVKPAPERSEDERKAIADYYRSIDKELVKLEKAVTTHKNKAPQLPADAKAQSVAEQPERRTTHVLMRGDFLSPGDPVEAGSLSVLPKLAPRGSSADRLDLAQWLVDPNNPLPARVMVNRVWQRLFGRGIVLTLDDFGKQGDKPSHPELLDWLASEFQGTGDRRQGTGVRGQGAGEGTRWSVKRLVRRIVSTATYQQSSAARRDLVARDPENVFVARQTRRRVEAEVIRDLALAASGQLAARIGGASVRPPQPAEYATLTYANSAKWADSTGGDRYRRGMYTFFQRTSPYPMLMTFDSPDSNECAVARQTSNTPLQALTLWNDPVFFECAQALGKRIVAAVPREADADQTARLRVEQAFLLCLGRRPTREETSDTVALYYAARDIAERDAAAAKKLVDEQPPTSENTGEVAAWISVGRALLNLDEFITRE